MDWTHVSFALLGTISGVMGWFLRELWDAVKKLRGDIDALRVHLAEDYVSYDRFITLMQPIRDQLSRIEGALIGKVDKK